MSNHFPTLDETQRRKPNTGVSPEDLTRINDAMRAVLAENEGLKRKVADLEKRLASVTSLYNREIEKSKRRKSKHG